MSDKSMKGVIHTSIAKPDDGKQGGPKPERQNHGQGQGSGQGTSNQSGQSSQGGKQSGGK